MTAIDGKELEQTPRSRLRPRVHIVGGLLVSLAAIAGVVWWALGQQTPTFPTGTRSIVLLVTGVGCYAAATVVRGVRWHLILNLAGIQHRAVDAFALIPVGTMGNNVLPARAGEFLRMFLLKGRSSANRREIFGSIIAERVLDTYTLIVLFAVMTAVGIAGAPTGGDHLRTRRNRNQERAGPLFRHSYSVRSVRSDHSRRTSAYALQLRRSRQASNAGC